MIYKRNDLDIMMLMRKYGMEIRHEQEQIRELNKQRRKNNRW
uniref:Uncharacterized protein n=1 Tax=Siphoviridae sp. ct8Ri8 TaxID=2826170 RepID=A0A8S5MT34_9CAUD|nr:MAG TPA: hypothetical protein [Siphoviridae sp. ct8Ri8]DAU39939.1 MAG TPA: hypothetical protein [Caudoviricetes sp.]